MIISRQVPGRHLGVGAVLELQELATGAGGCAVRGGHATRQVGGCEQVVQVDRDVVSVHGVQQLRRVGVRALGEAGHELSKRGVTLDSGYNHPRWV